MTMATMTAMTPTLRMTSEFALSLRPQHDGRWCWRWWLTTHSSDTLSDIESCGGGAASSSPDECDAPMDLASESEDDADRELYPLEGKYKDQIDKSRLLAMTEIDREAVLAERMAHIEREQQNRHLRNLLKSRNAADSRAAAAAAAAATRKSLRTKSAPKKTEEATKRGKLDELRRTREERKATGRQNSFGDEDASRRMLSDGEEADGFADDYVRPDERPIELDDVNRCRIGRTALGKLCDYPGFDQVAPDVFVRVSLWDKESNRSVYRMAQIKGIKRHRRRFGAMQRRSSDPLQASKPVNRTPCWKVPGERTNTLSSSTATLSATC